MKDYHVVWNGTKDRQGRCPTLVPSYPRGSSLGPVAWSVHDGRGAVDPPIKARHWQSYRTAKRDVQARDSHAGR